MTKLERDIIRLQQHYQAGIADLESKSEDVKVRVAELKAAITALGELWKIANADEPIPGIMEDGPVEQAE